jgi:hypothetical protein
MHLSRWKGNSYAYGSLPNIRVRDREFDPFGCLASFTELDIEIGKLRVIGFKPRRQL